MKIGYVSLILFALCLQATLRGKAAALSWSLDSPDKQLRAIIVLNEQQLLTYRIEYKTPRGYVEVLAQSKLGITCAEGDFSTNLSPVQQAERTKINERYNMLVDKKLSLQNRANELTLFFKNKQGLPINLKFRAYAEGIAFQYQFPKGQTKALRILSESSSFNLGNNGLAWMMPYDKASTYVHCGDHRRRQ